MTNSKRMDPGYKKENKMTFLILQDTFLQDPDLRKLKGYVIRVLWALIDYYDKLGDEPGCWATNKTMCTFLGISEETLRKHLRKLEKLGKIYSKEGAGNKSVYYSNSDTENSLNDTENSLNDTENSLNDTENQGLYNNIIKEKDIKEKLKKNLSFDKTSNAISSSKSKSKKASSVKIYEKESEPYLAATYLRILILKRYPKYDYKRCQNKAYLEKKIQRDAREVDLMIRIDKRPIDEIIEVIEWAQNDDFWCGNILSIAKLRQQYEKLLIVMSPKNGRKKKKEEELLKDPRPDITEKVIAQYKRFVGKDYKLTNADHNHFINTTKILINKLKKGGLDDYRVKETINDLVTTLRTVYSDKGNVVHPGMFCSDTTWTKLMPQVFVNVPQVCMFTHSKENAVEWDGIVAEEEQLTKDIERNLHKQNSGTNKPIGDTDNPELEHMLNI